MKSSASSKVIFGVRLKHIGVSKEKLLKGYQVEVFVTEPLGVETIVNFKHDDVLLKATYLRTF